MKRINWERLKIAIAMWLGFYVCDFCGRIGPHVSQLLSSRDWCRIKSRDANEADYVCCDVCTPH